MSMDSVSILTLLSGADTKRIDRLARLYLSKLQYHNASPGRVSTVADYVVIQEAPSGL